MTPALGHWSLVIGQWALVICWSLGLGHWSLPVLWLLYNRIVHLHHRHHVARALPAVVDVVAVHAGVGRRVPFDAAVDVDDVLAGALVVATVALRVAVVGEQRAAAQGFVGRQREARR